MDRSAPLRPDGGPAETPDVWARVVGTPEQVDRQLDEIARAAPPGSRIQRVGDDIRIWYPPPGVTFVDTVEAARGRHPSGSGSGTRRQARARASHRTSSSPPGDEPPDAARPGRLSQADRDAMTTEAPTTEHQPTGVDRMVAAAGDRQVT